MRESDNDYLRRASIIAQRATGVAHTRRARRIGIGILVFCFVFMMAGFLLVPHILRGILTGQVAAALHRPVSVARIRFNPYTLRLRVDGFRVGDHSEPAPFLEFAHLDVKISWSSAFRIAPVVTEVTLERPAIDVVRSTDGAFNFDDLLAPTTAPATPPAAPGAPLKFSVSNIRILDGNVVFDDRKVGVRHTLGKVRLEVPFIANLPGRVDVVVQPLLQMVVDRHLVRIEGVSRPFGGTLDTAVSLNFHRLDLPPYAGYLPASIAIKLPSGALSLDMLLHFKQSEAGPSITLTGAVAVDQLDLRDSSDAPVVAMDHGVIKMANVAPFDRVAHLREIALIGLKANLVRNHDGTLNFETLIGPSPPEQSLAPAAAPAASSGTAHPVEPAAASAPFDASIDSIKVINSSVEVTDLS